MRTPDIGSMRNAVTWTSPATDRDSYGQVNAGDVFNFVATVRAKVEVMKTEEVVQGKKPEGVIWYRITQRYLSGIQFNWQMNFDNRVFQVVGINDIEERHLFQEIEVCEIRI